VMICVTFFPADYVNSVPALPPRKRLGAPRTPRSRAVKAFGLMWHRERSLTSAGIQAHCRTTRLTARYPFLERETWEAMPILHGSCRLFSKALI
jgi:hypothetical protein